MTARCCIIDLMRERRDRNEDTKEKYGLDSIGGTGHNHDSDRCIPCLCPTLSSSSAKSAGGDAFSAIGIDTSVAPDGFDADSIDKPVRQSYH